MFHRTSLISALLLTALLVGGLLPAALADETLDKAFTALKTFDWNQERTVLKAIDDAVLATRADAAQRKELEAKLVAVLGTDAPQCAQDFVCRKLSLIGTAQAVPPLAKLLTDEKLSHMSRFALERMPCAEAVQALRDALPKAGGLTKAGIINSLGVRRDAASLPALTAALGDANLQIANAAAAALGEIGSPEAAKALADCQAKAPAERKLALADAQLVCAERLLADGKKAEALAIHKALSTGDQPKHVKLAAMRGLLAAAGRK